MKTIEIKADKKYIDYINRLLQDINFDDDIVAINYDHGMGYSIDWWTKDDKIN